MNLNKQKVKSEAYSEPCQTSKIECFEYKFKGLNLKAVDYFLKTLHLRCLAEFWVRF